MKRILFRSALISLAIVLVVYSADYLILSVRLARNISPYSTITVREYYAVQEKNSRTEYIYKGTDAITCVNALFPRKSYSPCWWARKHADKAVTI